MKVSQLREHVAWTEHPVISVRFTDKYGRRVSWASEDAQREALKLVESGTIGRHVMSPHCVIDIHGLGEDDRVDIHEGPDIAEDIRPLRLEQTKE